MADHPHPPPHLSRRHALAAIGGGALAVIAAACRDGSSGTGGTPSPTTTSAGTAPRPLAASGSPAASAPAPAPTVATAVTPGAETVSCVLTPELTQGPYYLDLDLVRSDITEGRDGVPLELTLVVADATTCRTIADAVVDIWHTDAAGTYSGVEGDPGTSMRGTQLTDASGAATFRTIYPGWYGGRPVHIHVMVHVGGDAVHTGQLFFRDEVSDEVFRLAPYDARGERDTRNVDDGIYARGGSLTTLALEPAGTGYRARMVMGVAA